MGGTGVALMNGANADVVGGTVSSNGKRHRVQRRTGHPGRSRPERHRTHVAVQGNATFANGGLGIDVAPKGVVDCSTAPPGPKGYMLCPVLTEASTTTMTSTECPGCTIEVFLAMPDAGDAGHGEGASLLGRTIAAGSGAWSVPLAVGAVGSGDRVTATATTPPSTVAPQSSEFAVNITVG